MDGPLLWYVNRGTGMVLLILLTASAVLGMWATRGEAGTRIPRFVVQAMHRNVALIGATLLGLHAVSAVVDEYVDIRWWHLVLPWGLRYEPAPLALGVIALDLLVAIVLTSLVRDRLPHGAWRALHLAGYAVLAAAFVHGFWIGTDSPSGWARWLYVACLGALVVSAAARLTTAWQRRRRLPRELDTVRALS